jgi:signal peptidase
MNVPTALPSAAPPGVDGAARAVDAVEPAPRRGTRRAIGAFFSLVGSLAVAAVVAVAVAIAVVPTMAGGHTLTVLSGSMAPALPVGSVVVDRPTATGSLRVGDVITYATTDEVSQAPVMITHRVIAIDASSSGPVFTTKGDANNVADDRPVTAAQVRGKVWYHVPYVGMARNFLLARGALRIILGGATLIGALWLLIHVLRSDSEPTTRRRRHRDRATSPGHVAVQAPATSGER